MQATAADPANGGDGGEDKPSRKRKKEKKEGRCAFFMIQKRRCCSMRPSPGNLYCGVHNTEAERQALGGLKRPLDGLPIVAAAGGRQRVPCPVDATHTVFADDVKRHVRVCNKRLQQLEMERCPYFCRNCNSGEPAGDEPRNGGAADALGAKTLPELTEGRAFADAIRLLYEQHVVPIDTVVLQPAACDPMLARAAAEGAEHAKMRHLTQQASIIGHMFRRQLIQVTAQQPDLQPPLPSCPSPPPPPTADAAVWGAAGGSWATACGGAADHSC